MKVPQRFLTAIDGDPGNCVLVVGAGLSKSGVREGGAGIPDWDELISLMIRHLDEADRVDAVEIAQLQQMLTEDPPQYLDVAEKFWVAHTDDYDGYETFLRRHLKPNDLIDSNIHKLIIGIGFRGIVSYNFDMVFEKQSDRLNRIIYPDLMAQIGHFQRRGFFAKIHGCISEPARNLVLTRSSYEELRRHPQYGELLATIFLANKILCVGFSLRDPDFLSILNDLKERWGTGFPPLFALMRNPGDIVRREWLAKGVDIIPYENHDEIAGFFSELSKLPTHSIQSVPDTVENEVDIFALWDR